jgi:hypothetical protein
MSTRLLSATATVALLLTTLSPAARAQDVSRDFLEAFALGADREAALELLVPGSSAWYRYRCLALQLEGRLDEARAVLSDWTGAFGRGSGVQEAEYRLALLAYDDDPDGTLSFLRSQLGLGFSHRQEVPGAQPDLPTRLEPASVSWEAFRQRALQKHRGTLDGFQDLAIEALISPDLDDDALLAVLKRLKDPGHPGLAALVVRSLDHEDSPSFGTLAIHSRLTLEQLEECARLRPSLLDDDEFVHVWLERLAPPVAVDWHVDADARGAYLDRLLAFVRRLPARQDSLKAHVLHHRLVHDRGRGFHDRDLFLEYLALPRRGSLRSDDFSNRHRQRLVSPDRSFPTGLPVIGDDSALVSAYLGEFFREDTGWNAYAEFLDDDVLRRLFAETKLLHGLGDAERWAALLDDPEALAALRDRVEIAFAPDRRSHYGPDDAVTLDVDLKHVDTLLLRVFEIDTFAAYTEHREEIDIDVALDGLVANRELVHEFSEPPLRRVRRTLQIPGLDGPGVWVVELVGNGVASRALVRKGRLRLAERLGSAGHVLRVLDDDGGHLPEAHVWFGERIYEPDERGEVLLPFSGSSPGRKPVVLRHGDRSSLAWIDHAEERYALEARVFVERESLLPGATARLVVRPLVRSNDRPASVALLEQPTLLVTATDHDGVETHQELGDLELTDGDELVHEITVPERLARLSVSMRGRVTTLAEGDTVTLHSAQAVFPVSAIAPTAAVANPMLGRTPDGYVLDVLGRNGEPLVDQAVGVRLDHEAFADAHLSWLRTDAAGRIDLGPLPGISQVRVEGVAASALSWMLTDDRVAWPHAIHAAEGELVSVPWMGGGLDRLALSLHELRGEAPTRDRFDHASLSDGQLELRDLPPGRYRLLLKEAGHAITLEIIGGPRQDGWVLGEHRMLPPQGMDRLQVRQARMGDDALTVRLGHASAGTRVHVSASRWLPAFDAFDALAPGSTMERGAQDVHHPTSLYAPARALSPEERYVLERRLAQVFPGNMLDRPTLLLNPWALDELETDLFDSSGSASVIGVGGGAGGYGGKAKKARRDQFGISAGTYADLSFLPAPAVTLTGLRPDADGVLRIPRSLLGPGHIVQVVAVDGEQTAARTVVLDESSLEPRDLRLAHPFAAERSVTEQRRIQFLGAGEQAVFEDVATSQAEVVDSLAAAFGLLSALGDAEGLAPFAPLTRWPDLTRDEQLAFYDEHACHELHLFLHGKDPAFFDEVVRPYLGNKRRLTFLDHWLLDHDLTPWLDPWEFSRLNLVERILAARRLPDEADAVERLLDEWLAVQPVSPSFARAQFETALGRTAFTGGTEIAQALSEAGKSARDFNLLPSPGPQTLAPPPASEADVALLDELEELGYLGRDSESDDRLRFDFARRGSSIKLFTGPGRTQRFVEHDYWHRRLAQTGPELLPVNGFWLDLARSRGARPFVSTHLGEVAGNLNADLLALALLDLPFTAGEHATDVEARRMTLSAASPLLLVRKEIADAPLAQDGPPVLVSQDVFRLDDRYRYEGSRRMDRFVSGEYVAGVVYGCQVVVTNPTSAQLDLELLMQVPAGAVPVARSWATRGTEFSIGPYATARHEIFFYFPAAGDFPHYPAQVSLAGEILAAGEYATRHVVTTPTVVDTSSWEHVSQNGTPAQVWAFLEDANPRTLDLTRMAWRLKDKGFFDDAMAWTTDRRVESQVVWSYGLYHGDVDAVSAYLRSRPDVLARCGMSLRSALLTFDADARGAYEHREFDPLVNQRAHAFGGERKISNPEVAAQWTWLLNLLSFRPLLDDADWMAVTYHLLLQDRVADAIEAFDRVSPALVTAPMHYDAMRAYLALSRGQPSVARALAETWADHPVPRWSARFGQILDHVDEATGRGAGAGSGEGGGGSLDDEPWLELDVVDGRLEVWHENLPSVELRYTPMDVELLFSTNPFLDQGDEASSLLRPARRDVIELQAGVTTTVVDLPPEFAGRNVFVEARAAGLVSRQAHYAHDLSLALLSSRGELRLTREGTDQALSSAYVKVYARMNDGSVRFHKDGYTDLRGRFDYASVTAEGGLGVDRFALLVLSQGDGAVIREVSPPAR